MIRMTILMKLKTKVETRKQNNKRFVILTMTGFPCSRFGGPHGIASAYEPQWK